MESSYIEAALRALGAQDVKSRGDWVMSACPLAYWTHESGVDRNPSFGVSVHTDGKPSIARCWTCCGEGMTFRNMVYDVRLRNAMHNAPYHMDLNAALQIVEGEDANINLPLIDYDRIRAEMTTVSEPIPEEYVNQNYLTVMDALEGLQYLRSRDVPDDQAAAFDLRFDHFDDRVVAITRDARGIWGLQGRSIYPSDKPYLFLPHDNSDYGVWFNEVNLDVTQPIVVTEGWFDALRIDECYGNVVANYTASITTEHLRRIQDASVVVSFLDSDRAGSSAVQALARHCSLGGKTLLQGVLPEGKKDPSASTRDEIREALKAVGLATNEERYSMAINTNYPPGYQPPTQAGPSAPPSVRPADYMQRTADAQRAAAESSAGRIPRRFFLQQDSEGQVLVLDAMMQHDATGTQTLVMPGSHHEHYIDRGPGKRGMEVLCNKQFQQYGGACTICDMSDRAPTYRAACSVINLTPFFSRRNNAWQTDTSVQLLAVNRDEYRDLCLLALQNNGLAGALLNVRRVGRKYVWTVAQMYDVPTILAHYNVQPFDFENVPFAKMLTNEQMQQMGFGGAGPVGAPPMPPQYGAPAMPTMPPPMAPQTGGYAPPPGPAAPPPGPPVTAPNPYSPSNVPPAPVSQVPPAPQPGAQMPPAAPPQYAPQVPPQSPSQAAPQIPPVANQVPQTPQAAQPPVPPTPPVPPFAPQPEFPEHTEADTPYHIEASPPAGTRVVEGQAIAAGDTPSADEF